MSGLGLQHCSPALSRELRDLSEPESGELRWPRLVTFYKNGDRYFRGKALRITPHRYLSLEALLGELSRWIPLANGVRRLYSPRGGRIVRTLSELRDGHGYVCAAFEPFRSGRYGQEQSRATAGSTEKQALFSDLSREHREVNLRATYPPIGRGTFGQSLSDATNCNAVIHKRSCCHAVHSKPSPAKPRIMTVIKADGQSHKKVTILLNRRCTQTFEQLVSDIAEALGHLRGKRECVKKLYTLKGKEVRSISDFYRGDDVFLAAGRGQLTLNDIQKVLEELYPNNPCAQSLIQRHWCHSEKHHRYDEMGLKATAEFEHSELAPSERQITKKMDEVRTRVGQQEREKARKWEQERWERENRELEEKVRQQVERSFDREEDEMEKWQTNKNEKQHKQKENNREMKKDVGTGEQECKGTEEITVLQIGGSECEEASGKQKMAYGVKEMERREEARKISRWKEEKSYIDIGGEQPVKNIRSGQKKIKEEKGLDHREKVKSERKQGQIEDHEWDTENKLPSVRYEVCKNTKQEDPRKCHCGHETSKNEEGQIRGGKEVEESPVKTIRTEQLLIRKDNSIHTRQSELLLSRHQQAKPHREIERYYEIGRTIGDGNFALVKECRLKNTEYEYAVKIIDKSKLKGKEIMIENEIAIVRSLSHPNIVRFIEEFETEEEIYLIMEYIHGGDLFDAITDSVKFTENNAALMMNNLCDALAYIHSKNIVHRDLKPENLLVQHKADGRTVLKLADFGLALKVTNPIFTVCGTPTYVAPEILSETGYGLEVDMWATGVILYILLCGFPPFRSLERDQEELFEMIQLGEYEFLSPYWDSISDGAKDLVRKLLVVNPRNRYTAQQVLQHSWIRLAAKRNTHNLQREVSMNIGQHFRHCRRQGIRNSAT
ncbi:serine/threonine-protein kinase DCLK1-like [Scyliorhinus canicula]|uniref:serine/threonine-protein kinase DCLK1-like n=1 Tax=Scyliorhinus canicula TaxID=7830 RepID=UPI0018F2F0FF|nr:serine/threonine-protein kinase DCLK1-like [Scyliorhinus canicula]